MWCTHCAGTRGWGELNISVIFKLFGLFVFIPTCPRKSSFENVIHDVLDRRFRLLREILSFRAHAAGGHIRLLERQLTHMVVV